MEEIVLDGNLVKYRVVGSGDQTIIFLHGWRSDSSVWAQATGSIDQKKYKCLVIDLPGFGQSPVPKTSYTLDDYADLVYTLAKKKELNNIVLVGHSFGGRIAIKLSAKHPELISKLVLIDSAGIKKEYPGRKKIASIAKPFFKPRFMHGLRKKIYQKMGSEDYVATPELNQIYLNTIAEDLAPLLSKIKQPTLLFWGGKDTVTPLTDAESMNDKIPNSELEIVDGEHFSFLDQPEKFLAVLNNFIK